VPRVSSLAIESCPIPVQTEQCDVCTSAPCVDRHASLCCFYGAIALRMPHVPTSFLQSLSSELDTSTMLWCSLWGHDNSFCPLHFSGSLLHLTLPEHAAALQRFALEAIHHAMAEADSSWLLHDSLHTVQWLRA